MSRLTAGLAAINTMAAVPREPIGKTSDDAIDLCERLGFVSSWHLTEAMMILLDPTNPNETQVRARCAIEPLRRWLENEHAASTEPMPPAEDEHEADAQVPPTATEVVADFHLSGNIAVAVTYLINGAMACRDPAYDMTGDVEKAVAALETYPEPS